MKWVKKGLIFAPDGKLDWMVTHASMPFAERIRNNIYRVYFCGRNEQCRAQMGYLEIDIDEPREILHITENPALEKQKHTSALAARFSQGLTRRPIVLSCSSSFPMNSRIRGRRKW